MRELVPSDIIQEKLLRDGTLKLTETEVEDALESMYPPPPPKTTLPYQHWKRKARRNTLMQTSLEHTNADM